MTWDDVGFANGNTSLLNAFQVSLIDRGSGDFDIEFRYEDIRWTTGDNSSGANGLGEPSHGQVFPRVPQILSNSVNPELVPTACST